jgi:nucleoid-associated protein YgaU
MLLNDGDQAMQRLTVDAATIVLLVGAALFALALVAEVLRRAASWRPIVRALDVVTPVGLRRIAAVVVACASVAAAAPNAGATETETDTSPATTTTIDVSPRIRSWLRGETITTVPTASPTTSTPATTTTTSTTPATVTTVSLAPSSTTTTAPPRVVVLPTPPTSATTRPTPSPNPAAASTYTVRPGDCLWSIAARRLAQPVSNHAIDRAWRRIYAANRTRIGPNPGVIRPGVVLALPPL